MADEVGQAPLPAAVRRGDRKAVQSLLAAGAEVDAVFTPPVAGKVAPLLAGYTSLMIAAADGDAGIIRDLLAAGADVNAVVDGAAVRRAARPEVKVLEEGRTALMLAADAGELEVVQILLESGADAGLLDPEGKAALSFALQRGYDEIADLLRSAGGGGTSPDAELFYAVRQGAAEAVRSALAAGASPDAAEEDAALGTRTPVLVLAARAGDLESVEALLAAGAAVDARMESERPPTERTALMAAAEAGHAEIVRILLRAGADPKLRDRSFSEGTIGNTTVAWPDRPRRATALILAVERGHVEAIEALLEGGADANDHGAGSLPTPLLAAIESGRPEMVRILLQAGADVEAGTRDETPLSLAVAKGSGEIVDLLLTAGAAGADVRPRGRAQGIRQATPKPREDRGVTYLRAGKGSAELDRDVKGDTLVLVRAQVDTVADAFRRRRGAEVWIQNAQGKEVAFSSRVFTIFRLSRQAWSIVRDELAEHRSREVTPEDARALSGELSTDSIYFELDGDTGEVAYRLYRSGEEMESFSHGPGFDDEPDEAWSEAPESQGTSGIRFRSRLRQVDLSEIDPLSFVDELLRGQDAYIPVPARGLSGPAGREILQIPGNIERVDLLVVSA